MNVIGLDLGTTTLSAVVMNAETGLVMETINIPNTAALPSAHAWESLQDADGIAALALRMIDQLKSRHAISAIGIDCQMHGILYVNERGNAIRRNPALRRAFEKVFRMPMLMPAHQEEAACGAALAAMAAAGIKDTLAQAQALIRCQ